MDSSAGLRRCIEQAKTHVATAFSAWDACDPTRSAACCEALDAAIREIRIAGREVSQASRESLASAKPTLRELRAEVHRLAGLVDSATAFSRGMQVVVGRHRCCGNSRAAARPRFEECA